MAFSFYASLKSIPREMREAATIYRFNWWQRFLQIELPYATIGLVWNSMMSVAGGWFFLMACEVMFTRLPLARPRLLPAIRRRQRRYAFDTARHRHHDRGHRAASISSCGGR